jgi:Domain of unknown function (DUF1844)
MAVGEPEEGFKVTDRRRRTEDDAAANAPRDRAAHRPAPPSPPEPASRPPTPPVSPPEDSGIPERSLVGLFVMLGTSALIALGEAADPASGQRQRDLPGAADVIDILLLLREKTEGRRSAEETQVLTELLYDLQLRYVTATKRPG